MSKRLIGLMAAAFLAANMSASAATPVAIVTLGDSTTAPRNVGAALNGRQANVTTQGENSPDPGNPPHNRVHSVSTSSPWLYVYSDVLRDELPMHGVNVKAVDNEGIGGTRTDQAIARLAADVRAKLPEYVVVQFGINDSWWDAGQPADLNHPDSSGSRIALNVLAQTGGDGVLGNGNDHLHAADGNYTDNLVRIVTTMRADGATVILMTPNQLSPTGEVAWRNVLLGQYAQAVRDVAAAQKTPLIDVWKLSQDYAETPGHHINDLLLDSQHPNARGHRLIAGALITQIAVPEPSCGILLGIGSVALAGYLRSKNRDLH